MKNLKQKNLNKLFKLGNDILENSEILIYSENMKSYKKLESFTKYCIKNPNLRFWQALITWHGFNISEVDTDKNGKTTYTDLFYK